MMNGLQQQRPWGVTAMTRSLPQAQHGSARETDPADASPRAPFDAAAPTPRAIAERTGVQER